MDEWKNPSEPRHRVRRSGCERLQSVFGRFARTSKNYVFLKDCQDCSINGLQVHDVFNAEAAIVLEDCRGINVNACNLFDCKSPGILAKNLSESRIQGCLIGKAADAREAWKPIVVEGGGGNRVEE